MSREKWFQNELFRASMQYDCPTCLARKQSPCKTGAKQVARTPHTARLQKVYTQQEG